MATESDDRPGEPVRRGEGAEGFPHGSKYPLFVGLGMFLLGVGLSMWPLALVAGVPVILYGIVGWTYEYAIVEFESGIVPEQKRQLLGVKSGYLAMLLVIFGELLIFASLFVVWFYLKTTRGPFPPEGLPGPNLLNGTVLTAIMLVGAAAMGWSRVSINRGNRSQFSLGLAAALVAGVAFLVVLGFEYASFADAGVTYRTGPYGSAYYVVTATHAAHLIAGIALTGIVGYRAWVRDHFGPDRHLMVSTTEAYWYFLAFVSVLVLAFVYYPI